MVIKNLPLVFLLSFCSFFAFSQIPAPGNVLWLKADAGTFNDAGTTLATNGQTVQQWNDQSGNANHATQTLNTLKPTFVSNVLNGQPVVRFSSRMLVTPNIDLSGIDKVDMYIVYNSVNLSGTWECIVEEGPDFNTVKGFTFFDNAQTVTYNGIYAGHSGGGFNAKNYPFKANTFKVVNSSFDRAATAANEVNLRINGVDCSLLNQNFANDNTGNYSNVPLYIGNRGNAVNSYPLLGDIAEIILYNRKLTLAEKTTIETYLNSKYGIQCAVNNPAPGSGNCLRMGTYGAYAQEGSDIDFGSNDFTVEFWTMKRALSAGGANSACVNKWNTSTSPGTNEWAVATSTDGSNNIPAFFFETGSIYYQANASTSLVANKWYHIAAVREGNNIKIYVNGILEGTTAIPPGSSVNNVAARTYMALGYYPGGFGNNSDLDELRIWNTALSQTTIRDWMCKKETSLHPNHLSLERYYRFDEPAGLNIWSNRQNNCTTELYSNGGATAVSGAPLGDASSYDYTANTATANVNFGSASDNLSVSMNAGTSAAVHVYGVNELPNNIYYPSLTNNNQYAGVFVVNGDAAARYDVNYNYSNNPSVTPAAEASLKLYKRTDNAAISNLSWTAAPNQSVNTNTNIITATGQNTEYILGTAIPTLTPPTCNISFDGAGSYVNINNTPATMPTTGTIEFWMNQPSFSDWQIPISTFSPLLNAGSFTDGMYFQTYANGNLYFIYASSFSVYGIELLGTLTANRNYHIALSWDLAAQKIKGYVDGNLIFVKTLTTTFPTTLPKLTLGGGFDNGRYYNGTLDEVRLWNIERTQAEIIAGAQTISGNESGLLAYYHFNENTIGGNGQTVLNKCTATGAALNGTTVSANSYPKFPCGIALPTCSITLNGTSDKVTVPDNAALNFANNFTIQAYVKRTANFTDRNRVLFLKKNSASSADADPGYTMIVSYSGHSIGAYKPLVSLGDGTNYEQFYPANAGDNIVLNDWTNIAFVYDKTTHTGTFYLNGAAVSTTKIGGTVASINSNESLNMGGYAYTSPAANAFFPGKMDEISFWNAKRTAGEIYTAMSSSLIGNEANLVAYYHFNDNNRSGQNRTITNFCSATGAALNGTTVGSQTTPVFECAPPPFTSPECNIQLNGTTDYIFVPNNAALNLSNFSAGAYIKTTVAGSSKSILGKVATGTNLNYALDINAANRAMISFTDNGTGNAVQCVGTSTVTDGNWHYVVGTYDGTGLKIYVDGVLENTVATSAIPMTGSSPLYAGSLNGAIKFNGSLDEISIWNIPLSLTQVQNLIGQGLTGTEAGLATYYNFTANNKDGTGQVIINSCASTGALLNGTSIGTASTPAFTCSALPVTPPSCSIMLNGKNDAAYMNNGGMSYPTISNNFTMEVKAKPLLPTSAASGAQFDGLFAAPNYVFFPDQGEGSFAPGHAGVGISLGTNGMAVYEHATNYIPARIILNNHPVNDWVHLTLVSSNGVLKLYENGVLIGSANSSGYTLHPSAHIGGYYGKFAGYVGEVRIWNAALTSDQVRTNLNANLSGAEANLVGLYKFNSNGNNGPNQTIAGTGSMGTTNIYTTTGSNATPIFTCANTVNVNRDTLPGSGIMYTHNNSGIEFAELGNLGNIPVQGSLMVWLNAATLKDKAVVFSTSHLRDVAGGYKGIKLFSRADGRLQLAFGTDTTVAGFQDTVTVLTTFAANKWYHFTLSWDTTAKTYTTYINGIQTAAGSTNFWPVQFESFKAGIGFRPDATYSWAGSIDELSEWDKILSPAEIRQQLASKIKSTQSNWNNVLHYYRFDNNFANTQLYPVVHDFKGTVHGMVYQQQSFTSWYPMPTSSAPIGLYSSYQYAGNNSASSLYVGNAASAANADLVTATLNSGTADGIHVYGEDKWPNTINGIADTLNGSHRYAGVFVANGNNAQYTLVYDYTNNPYVNATNELYLKLKKRDHNAIGSWTAPANLNLDMALNTITCTGENTEYILEKSASAVPARWLGFTASLNSSKQSVLNWRVTNETNVSHYEVEWKTVNGNWKTISSINYNQVNRGNYEFIHTAPEKGNNFYRIKQVDLNGEYNFSSTGLVKLAQESVIRLYPNPAKTHVMLVVPENISFQLFDMLGNKVAVGYLNSGQSRVNISGLPGGVYSFRLANGHSIRFVKQ
ncbi:MAG: LamG-like jellyroll fold domain-containing protein [Ferruginibacter sp.]